MGEKKYIDLHTHTYYSDGGTLKPKELVEIAALGGINILAKTDHDNLKGYEEAREAAEKWDIILFPGVEITTQKYHLLGINFNPDKEFSNFIEYSKELQRQACGMRIDILKREGIPITLEKVIKEFPDSRVGQFNINYTMHKDRKCREYLRNLHPEKSPNEIFKYYFCNGGIADNLQNRPGVTDEQAIRAIHKAGGLVGLAHPPKDIDDMNEMDRLVGLGIDFIEIQLLFENKYPYSIYENYAKKNNIPVSYGSDYHGPTMHREMLKQGKNILSPELEELLNQGYIKISKKIPKSDNINKYKEVLV